jgi:hypothetical protein
MLDPEKEMFLAEGFFINWQKIENITEIMR